MDNARYAELLRSTGLTVDNASDVDSTRDQRFVRIDRSYRFKAIPNAEFKHGHPWSV